MVKDSIERIIKKEDLEYVLLKDGLEIEITKIYSLDGEISPHHTDDFFNVIVFNYLMIAEQAYLHHFPIQ